MTMSMDTRIPSKSVTSLLWSLAFDFSDVMEYFLNHIESPHCAAQMSRFARALDARRDAEERSRGEEGGQKERSSR